MKVYNISDSDYIFVSVSIPVFVVLFLNNPEMELLLYYHYDNTESVCDSIDEAIMHVNNGGMIGFYDEINEL